MNPHPHRPFLCNGPHDGALFLSTNKNYLKFSLAMLSGTKGPHQIKMTKQIESTKFDQMNTVHCGRAEGPISQNINFH